MIATPDIHVPARREERRSLYLIDCAGAQLRIYRRSLATVLCFYGEIDVSNNDLVAGAVGRYLRLNTALVVDLSGLTFLAVAGYRTLISLNGAQHRAQSQLTVVTGPALRPLVRAFPGHGLLLVGSITQALRLMDAGVREPRDFLSDVRNAAPSTE